MLAARDPAVSEVGELSLLTNLVTDLGLSLKSHVIFQDLHFCICNVGILLPALQSRKHVMSSQKSLDAVQRAALVPVPGVKASSTEGSQDLRRLSNGDLALV